jgi:hypothetical protein
VTKHSDSGGGGVEVEEEVTWQTCGCMLSFFSCKKKEQLIIEVVTLLEYVNNF